MKRFSSRSTRPAPGFSRRNLFRSALPHDEPGHVDPLAYEARLCGCLLARRAPDFNVGIRGVQSLVCSGDGGP